MGRAPCCDKENVKKGPWSPEEDAKLKKFIEKYGTGGNWIALPQKAGLKRCGKSCRLRWLNYLRPNIKHGDFSDEEDRIICTLFSSIGSRWSVIAAQLPGRTDNDIKNYWNTKLKKKLMGGMTPLNHRKPKPYPPDHPLQTPQSQLPPLHRDLNSYYMQAKSLTGLDESPLVINYNNPSLMATNCHLLQAQESLLISPMQCYPEIKERMLVFGGDQTSCSSSRSDGSCSQISHGKEIKQEEMVLQSYISNGFEFEDNYNNQKFMNIEYGNNGGDDNQSTWTDQKQNGFVGGSNPPLVYDLEEVSTGTNNIGCGSFFFLSDENKTEERIMYYY